MSAPHTHRATDAPAYEAYFGFTHSPFTLAPDPRFLYLSETHDVAISRILQSIRRKEGFIVLTGDIGTGKTTLCRALLQKLDTTAFTSLVLNPFVSVDELLREVLLDFGVVSRESIRSGRLASATQHELISTVHDFLLSLVPIHGAGILIIDEAQHLSAPVLEQIRVLSNLETSESKLLQIVLVGQLDLLDVLARADVRQLDQRISLRATLAPLGRADIEAYVGHRLAVAGGSSTPVFEPAAIDRLAAISDGVPRVINLLCDRALAIAAGIGVHTISPEIVGKAARELELRHAPAGDARQARTTSDDDTAGRTPLPRWAAIAALATAAGAALLLLTPFDHLVAVQRPQPPAAPPLQIAAPLAPRVISEGELPGWLTRPRRPLLAAPRPAPADVTP